MSSSRPSPGAGEPAAARTFRLPALAYLIVLFLFFCVAPLAFTDSADNRSAAVVGPQTLLVLIPVAVAVFIARTATVVGRDGIRVRALLGRRDLPWDEVRGLSVAERSVYAVVDDGAVRLPCVRVADLAALSQASGGRLPEIEQPRPKFAPSRRRRR
ncbi:MAG: hypothetical protein QOE97_230 [Pseudonocardiales bacterium]|nr:hypothetical protein [Pseudonocardiales bacterium]